MREAILALLKTRPRVGEQTLKLEARRQHSTAHKAEAIADQLVEEGLATTYTSQQTGARYWALAGKVAAPPSPSGDTEEPTPAAPAAPPAPLPSPVEARFKEKPAVREPPRPTARVGEMVKVRLPANDREPTPPPSATATPSPTKITAAQQIFLGSLARDLAKGDPALAATLLISVGVNLLLASGQRTDSEIRADVASLTGRTIDRWRGESSEKKRGA